MMMFVAYVMTILLLYRVEQIAGYVDLCTTENANVYDKAGAVVGAAEHKTFESHEFAAVDTHLFATAKRTWVGGDAAVGIADHAHKAAHLLVGDYCHGSVAVFGAACNVDHESLDVWQKDNLLTPHGFCAADEDKGGEDDALNELAAAVAPCAHFFLGSHINLIVFFAVRLRGDACQEPLATKLFGVVVDDGDIPLLIVFGLFFHAYGAGGKCYRRTSLLHWCIAIHTSLVCLAQHNRVTHSYEE